MEEKLKIMLLNATKELSEFIDKRDIAGKTLSFDDEKMQAFTMGKMSILIELMEEISKDNK